MTHLNSVIPMADSDVSKDANTKPNPNYQENKCCPLLKQDGREVVPMTKRQCKKNLIIMSFCYFLFFLGFWSIAVLQSTMNALDGLGTESQAVIYGVSMVSSLFLSELVVQTIGCKRTLVYGLLISCSYIAANLYAIWATLIPSSVLYGLASGPVSTALTIYVEELAVRYARESEDDTMEHIMASFFGIFVIFSENTQIWGNVVSYFVLNVGSTSQRNHTSTEACGINFQPGNVSGNHNLDPPSEDKRYMLIGFYLSCGVLAAVGMQLFLDPLHNDVEGKMEFGSVCERVCAAVNLLQRPKQLLMIPLAMFNGMEAAFYASDFTEAFIACTWGVQYVGLISIFCGACGCVMAMMVGPFVKRFSQLTVILLACAINTVTFITLYLWHPSSVHVTVYMVIAGAWGTADAIWCSQVPALYGLMFPKDRNAAYSNLWFWNFFGAFLQFSYTNYFRVVIKINFLFIMLITGVSSYLLCHFFVKNIPEEDYIPVSPDNPD